MKVKLLTETAKLPTRGTGHSVGYDFYSDESIVLEPFDINEEYDVVDIDSILPEWVRVPKIKTGCAIALPEGHVGLFRDRSSYGSKGIIVTGGVIDPDYRDEVLVCLINLNEFAITIPQGSKICQMLVMPCNTSDVVQVSELSKTERNGGFGSTGN